MRLGISCAGGIYGVYSYSKFREIGSYYPEFRSWAGMIYLNVLFYLRLARHGQGEEVYREFADFGGTRAPPRVH